MVSPRRRVTTKQITSRANPIFKALRGASIGFHGDVILIEGKKLITEALTAGLRPRSAWSHGPWPLRFECPTYVVPVAMYTALSPTKSGKAPLAVFTAPIIRKASSDDLKKGRFLLLDQIQEPGNAGALVRAAAAFSMTGVVWLKPCAYPYQHAAIRAAAGSCFQLPQWTLDNIPNDLDTPIIGTASTASQAIDGFSWPQNLLLALGNEGHGLSETVSTRLWASVAIPIAKSVESLNVAGAAHILMHQMAALSPVSSCPCPA